MTCSICGQKAQNCDCTMLEKEMYERIQELEYEQSNKPYRFTESELKEHDREVWGSASSSVSWSSNFELYWQQKFGGGKV